MPKGICFCHVDAYIFHDMIFKEDRAIVKFMLILVDFRKKVLELEMDIW